ncbi:hypothetical protein ccbrp13_13160 [Ktedonobacteria bacterium brp13]|nr:hypothetical protein ccbrp13_13160 [Ktedonobacteria bacterium brp13]
MFNASTGWAMTAGDPVNGQSRILHTTKGVAHWQDVTPATGKQPSFIGGSDFFDALTAWVVVGSAPGIPMVVYRTHDGGQSWQQARLPDQDIGRDTFFFLNARVGWLMLTKGAATGNVWVDVLRTSDGGASWKIISLASYTTASPSALPLEGSKSISFVNETTGWATSITTRENFAELYVTHDGGTTWRHQNIPLPVQDVQVTMLPPSFFSATDGLLPAIISSRAGETMTIYVTHDGGVSWHPTSPVQTGWSLIAIADAQHAWIVNSSYDVKSYQYIHSTVYSTRDGGWHWTQHTVKFSANPTMIDFVSPTQGWAIDEGQSLYQTADGGQTWVKVTPTIP